MDDSVELFGVTCYYRIVANQRQPPRVVTRLSCRILSHLPFVRIVVELSVELPHRDRLGVEVKRVHLLVTLALHPKSLLAIFASQKPGTRVLGVPVEPLHNFAGLKIKICPQWTK